MNIDQRSDHTNSPLHSYWYQQDTETKEFFKAVKPIYCHYINGHCYMNMLNIDKHWMLVRKYNSYLLRDFCGLSTDIKYNLEISD